MDLNSRLVQTKNRSVCENAVTGLRGSCRLLVMGSWENLMLGVTVQWSSTPSRGIRNTLSRFMLQKPEMLRPDGSFGLNADFILPVFCTVL